MFPLGAVPRVAASARAGEGRHAPALPQHLGGLARAAAGRAAAVQGPRLPCEAATAPAVAADREPRYHQPRPVPTPTAGSTFATQTACRRKTCCDSTTAAKPTPSTATPPGRLFASDGICTHGNTHLADGLVQGGLIECPKHNGRYRLADGSPARAPVCRGLCTYPVESRDGPLFLNVARARRRRGPPADDAAPARGE